jgi:hypothetical protein
MKLKTLLNRAIAAIAMSAAFAPVLARADVTRLVTMNFQSGATFIGDVTFANDFSQVTGVSGTLSGSLYGVDPINWVWLPGTNFSSGAYNFSTFLMDGGPPEYNFFVQFAYNYSSAQHLTFTSGVSYDGADNSVGYADPLVSGLIGAPEAATWAMMAMGFAALGLLGNRARRTPVAVAF